MITDLDDSSSWHGLAEHGYLPRVFKMRSKYGTPTAGIMFNTLVIIVFSCADFGQLLQLLNSVYAMALLLEYAAFVKLRLFHKECTFSCRLFLAFPAIELISNLVGIGFHLGLQCNDRTAFQCRTGLPS